MVIQSDVVVVGGGLAGMAAAWTAARSGARVVLLDKARAGTSGPTAFAAGDLLCWLPAEDDLQEWVEAYLEAGLGLNSRSWLERLFQGNYGYVRDLVEAGFPLETAPDGSWVRRSGRGPIVKCVLASMLQWQEMFRQRCKGLGVRVLDRVAAEQLLVQQGRVVGVAGFDVRGGEAVAVASTSTVLAAGGCSYRGLFFGQNVVAGEGLKMALDAGAALAYMEYGNQYNVSLLRFPTYGQSKFMAHGGKYVNCQEEPFLATGKARLGHRSTGNESVKYMVEEVKAGKGPIFLDLSQFQEWDLVARLMPNLMRMLQRAGVDLREIPHEAVPAFTGTSNASAAGVLIDGQGQSSVPGLYAAGDCACKGLVVGAAIGMTGISLAWANYTGHLAGASAAIAARDRGPIPLPTEALEESTVRLLELRGSERPLHPRQLLMELSDLMGRVDVSLIRHEMRLQAAMDRVRVMKSQLAAEVGARDGHELMLWHEVAASLDCAESTLLCALERRETRGGHFREDYPETDPKMATVLLVRREGGDLRVERT